MKKIALVTDSTADLTEEVQKKYDIHVIPLKIRFGNSEYFDHEITSEEFYRRLAEEEELPQTSQPTPDEFDCLYRKLLKEYNEIISIHISSGLSGTLNSAHLAKEKLKAKIHIIDSKNISLGMGLMVLEASRNIREGLDARHIVEKITNVRKNIETLFTLNTLEYLQKGGRVGKMQAVAGDVLNIKVILEINEEGYIVQREKARGRRRAIERILEIMEKEGKDLSTQRIGISHSQSEEEAAAIANEIKERLGVKSVLFGEITATVGTHVGPGCLAFFFQT